MKPSTRYFLERVREAQDPSAADEARVLLALRATLAAGAASSAVASATLEQLRVAGAKTSSGLIGSKLTIGLVCTAAAFLGTSDSARAPAGAEAPLVVAHGQPSEQAARGARLHAADGAKAIAPAGPAPLPEPGLLRGPSEAARAEAEPRAPLPRAPDRARRDGPHGEPRRTPASGLRLELELLQRVQQQLRQGDAEGALRSLESHRTRDRVLLAERQAARILALCGVGRVAEAREAAAAFERDHPDSVQRAAIASSCANL